MSPVEGELPELVGLSRRLERLRELGDISARALSMLIGASPNTVANLEAGRSRTPRSDILLSLARVLGTSAEYLAFGQGECPSVATVRDALGLAGYDPAQHGEPG